MKFSHSIIFVGIFVFIFNIYFSPVYATHILDGQTYYDDHPFQLKITNPTSPPVVVTVDSPASGTCSYTLTQITGTSTWQSSYIYFTTGSTCTSTTLPMGTSLIGSFTATSNDTTPTSETGTVIAHDDSGWPPSATNPPPQWAKKISNCSTYGGDSPDDDGICNAWEIALGEDTSDPNFQGLKVPYVDTGTPAGFWKLPCGGSNWDQVCPTDSQKDVYVEVDWMRGHPPSQTAINNVIGAFNSAGVAKLHVLIDDDDILHRDMITTPVAGGTGSTDFDTIKKAFFGTDSERAAGNEGTGSYNHKLTSKKQVFHYALFIHKQSADPTSSGIAEQPGNDFVISLGNSAFAGSVGSGDQQEGTFMHELGHNLKLDHGGGDAVNCKPNYLSVMSYSRQFRDSYPTVDRDLDYSKKAIGPKPDDAGITVTLNEASLNESGPSGGIDPYLTLENIVYGVNNGAGFMIDSTNSDVNWDGDANPSENPTTTAHPHWMIPRGCTESTQVNLVGMNDWTGTYMDYSTKDSSSWSDGARSYFLPSDAAPGLSSNISADQPTDTTEFRYFDYAYPTFKKVNNTNVKKLYQDWFDNNILKTNIKERKWMNPYKLPMEITSNTTRDFRLSSVDYLDYKVQNLNDHSFSNPVQGKSNLHDHIKEVRGNAEQDNMNMAVYELFNVRISAIKEIDNNQNDRDSILSLIDNMITQFEIASTTYESIPYLTPQSSNAIVELDHDTYGTQDTAIFTVTDISSNLDPDNIDTILARLSSTANPVGIIIELRETGDNTAIFQSGGIQLDTGFSDSARKSPQVRVHEGDRIWASYNGALDSADITIPQIT